MTTTPTKTRTYDVMVSHSAWFLFETENAPYPNENTDIELYLDCVEVQDENGNEVALKVFETPADPIPAEWRKLGGFAKLGEVVDCYQLEAAPDLDAITVMFGRIVIDGETHFAEDTEQDPYGYSVVEKLG